VKELFVLAFVLVLLSELGIFEVLFDWFVLRTVTRSRRAGFKFPTEGKTIRHVLDGIEGIRYSVTFCSTYSPVDAKLELEKLEENRDGKNVKSLFGKILLPEQGRHWLNDIVSMGALHEALHLRLAARRSFMSFFFLLDVFRIVEIFGIIVMGIVFFGQGTDEMRTVLHDAFLRHEFMSALARESLVLNFIVAVVMIGAFLLFSVAFFDFLIASFRMLEETAVYVMSLRFGNRLYDKSNRKINVLMQTASYLTYVASFTCNSLLFACVLSILAS